MALKGEPRIIGGLSEVSAQYGGFILDLWGVVHDGLQPFPQTIETLKALKKTGACVFLLSNAPRRAHVIAAILDGMGIGPALYDGLVTSGEATHVALRDRYLQQWGRRCYHLGDLERDANVYADLAINIVPTVADADFILATGVEHPGDKAEKYHPVLEEGAARGLPLLCANPDRIVHVGNDLVLCPGAFADIYAALGGGVTYFGKPYRSVYSLCLEGIGKGEVLAIGDGMQTDIAGATGAGLDSVLITSGIHREVFSGDAAAPQIGSRVTGFLNEFPYRPTYLMDVLRW